MPTWTCATHGPVPAGEIRHLDHNSPHGQERHECGSSAGLDWTKTKEHEMTTETDLQPVAAETCAPEPHVWAAHMRGGEPVHVEICMGCGEINWDGLREQVAALVVTSHPEEVCGRCGGPNIPWSAPSPLWNEVMRGGDINATDLEMHHGIVCPTCFAVLAEQAGIADLWQLSAKRVHVPLQTVTPSGRMWNEQTWLWDKATKIRELEHALTSTRAEVAKVSDYIARHFADEPASDCEVGCCNCLRFVRDNLATPAAS